MLPPVSLGSDMDEISNFCTGDICHLRPGAPTTPEQGLPRAALRDDPPWVCHLDCQEASGLNATQKSLLHPPYEISNSLMRLPLGAKVGCQRSTGAGALGWPHASVAAPT